LPRPLTPPAAAARATPTPGTDAAAALTDEADEPEEPDDGAANEGTTKPPSTAAASIGGAAAGIGWAEPAVTSAMPEPVSSEGTGRRALTLMSEALTPPTPPRAPAVEAGAGESLFEGSEAWSPAVDPAEAPRLLEVPLPESLDGPPRAADVAREGAFDDAGVADDESADLEPADPAEPEVSANAMGIDAIAEPTPNATARAPTRPMTPANVMSSPLRRAWISMDGTTIEACTPAPTPIETINNSPKFMPATGRTDNSATRGIQHPANDEHHRRNLLSSVWNVRQIWVRLETWTR
jgi:hypothetical protein